MAYIVAMVYGMTIVVSSMLKVSEHSPRTASAKYEMFKICGYPSGFE